MIRSGAGAPVEGAITICREDGPPIRFRGELVAAERAPGSGPLMELRLWRRQGGYVAALIEAVDGGVRRRAECLPTLEAVADWVEALRNAPASPKVPRRRDALAVLGYLDRDLAASERAERLALLKGEALHAWLRSG